MIVCLCYGVSDERIRQSIRRGARTLELLEESCGAGGGCGACVRDVEDILNTSPNTDAEPDGGSNGKG